jgi:TPR repeat protein
MAGTPEAHVEDEQFGESAPLQVSHMQVTDRTTEDAIRTLSRYELAGLRRRAVYGDDSAAFQIGMAYELGHGVRQSCTTAAQWVARAAGDGNAAAQYNLGVRYRDGDGVPVNENEAVKWLQKAAAQQSPNAQLALLPLTAHRARFVTSRP